MNNKGRKQVFFSDSFEPEIAFNLQEKSLKSIPGATITQESFIIVVETTVLPMRRGARFISVKRTMALSLAAVL